MSLQQLSIIVENRPGSLASTFQVLADAGIDINGVPYRILQSSAYCV